LSESAEQVKFVKWFKLQYPKYKELIWATPSGFFFGGKPTPKQMGQIKKLKSEGWCSGIPDIHIAVPFGDSHGLFIEFKDVGKTYSSLSESQKVKLEALQEVGYTAIWCAGFELAKEKTEEYFNEL